MESFKKHDMKINPTFHDLIPPLATEEYAQLESNILKDGCRDPLVTWNGTLIDGHNRYAICQKHGIEFDTKPVQLPDEDAAKVWIIRNQFGRRNLSASQRAALAVELIPFLEKEAKAAQSKAVKRRHENDKIIKAIEADNPYWEPLPYEAELEIKAIHDDARRKGKSESQRVYFISTGAGKIKIGIAAFPSERLKTFQTSDPAAKLIDDIPGGSKVEKWIHGILADERVGKSEVFNDTPKVRAEIDAVCSLGKNVQTTEIHSAAIAGKEFGVSPTYVKQAKKMKEDFPERFEEVKRGERGLSDKQVHVGHNSGENEWYTPNAFIDAARTAMGSITCDPASSEIANKTVRADMFFTKEQDGLNQKWKGNVWMNPPYAQPLVADFADAVCEKLEAKEIKQAIVLVNNATETVWFQQMLSVAVAVCFIKGRVKFLDPNGNPGAPLQGQVAICLGGDASRFQKAFAGFGPVLFHELV